VYERNVGGLDRLVRVALTVVLTVVSVVALANGQWALGGASGAGALGVGFNAVAGWCGLNALCGIDSTRN